MENWPMIIFTVLGQLSVGAILMLGIVNLVTARRQGEVVADRLATQTLWLVGGTLVLGFLATPFHLGQPLRALNAVLGFSSSWLSREIVFGLIFALMGLAFTLLQWRKIGPVGFRRFFGLATGVMGLVLVYSMAMIYLRPSQPGWNSWTTVGTFFATTILLGSVATAAYLAANYRFRLGKDAELDQDQAREVLRSGLRLVSAMAIVALGFELLVIILNSIHLVSLDSTVFAESMPLLITRVVLVFVGAAVFGMLLLGSSHVELKPATYSFAYAAFIVVLISEFIGRYLFYVSQVTIGLAG